MKETRTIKWKMTMALAGGWSVAARVIPLLDPCLDVVILLVFTA